MRVLKFGGTSVGDAEAFRQTAGVVEQARAADRDVVVVVSAMSGVTDTLVEAAGAAADGEDDRSRALIATLLERHQATAGALLDGADERRGLDELIVERLREVERFCQSVAVLHELTPRTLDAIASMGERLAAPMLAAALRARGVPAAAVEGAQAIVTDDSSGAANPLMDESRVQARRVLLPLLEQGTVPVVTGFMAATAGGLTTTLGRGGSDYSAGILGACLDAAEVQIWTDVDGILTADPRVVPRARTLASLSYTEAAELSYFGAKVLHPKTILPAMERGIPVRILNTFNPNGPSTRIVRQAQPAAGTVKALTAIKGMSLVTVEGRGMLGVPGIAARTFGAVARVGGNVLMISQASSEQSICFVVPRAIAARVDKALLAEFERELGRHHVDRIWSEDDVAIVSIVGAGMRGTPGVAARIFAALGRHQVNVIAIAQGSSECNVSLVLDEGAADAAVRHVHDEFRLEAGAQP